MILKRSLPPILLLIPWVLFSQVDISGYADQSLFDVKPIIIGQDQENEFEETEARGLKSILQPGFEFLDAGKLEDAHYFFSTLSDQYPELPQPQYFIGVIEFQRRNYDEAKSAFQKALRIDPLYLQSKYMYGMVQIRLDELDEAVTTMEALIQFPAYKAQGYYGLGLIRAEKPYPKNLSASKMFEKAIEQDSMFLEAYRQLAVGYFYQRKTKKAVSILNKAISISPQWQEAIVTRAMISVYVDENTDQFEKDINYLIELDPMNFHYLSLRGFLNIELGNYSQAVEDIRLSLNIRDTSSASGFRFISILSADQVLTDILNYYYSNKEDLGINAQNYIDRGICEILRVRNSLETEEIPNVYFDSAALHTKNPTVDYLKATAYRINGKNNASLKAYTRLIKRDSTIWQTYLLRGDLYKDQGQYDSAYRDYSTFITGNKRELIGYQKRGKLLYEVKNYRRAYIDFSFVISMTPYNYDVLLKRAICAHQLKAFESSNFDLDLCIEKGLGKVQGAYYFKHLNYLHLGDTLSALISLDSASFYDTHNQSVHIELVELASTLDSIEYIKNGFERLIKYSHNKYEWYYQRGKWNFNQGNYQQAYFDLRRLVEDNRKNGEVCYYYGKTLLEIGYIDEGENWLKRSRKLGYKPPSG